MHWNNMKHPFILRQSSFKRLAEKWAGMITALEVDDRVLEHLGVTRAQVDAMPQAPTTWIDAVVYMALGPAVGDWRDLGAFHLAVSSRAVSHMKLALANIHRSAWILGGILCNDVEIPLESAHEFLRHLDTTPPSSRNHFDNAFMATEGLYQDLSDFAHQHGPQKFLLWHGHGRSGCSNPATP